VLSCRQSTHHEGINKGLTIGVVLFIISEVFAFLSAVTKINNENIDFIIDSDSEIFNVLNY
jgi:hypothetical protein